MILEIVQLSTGTVHTREVLIPSDMDIQDGLEYILEDTDFEKVKGVVPKYEKGDNYDPNLMLINGDYYIAPAVGVKEMPKKDKKKYIGQMYKEVDRSLYTTEELSEIKEALEEDFDYKYIDYLYNLNVDIIEGLV